MTSQLAAAEDSACLTSLQNDFQSHTTKTKQGHLKSLLLVTEGCYYKNYHNIIHHIACMTTSAVLPVFLSVFLIDPNTS